MNDSPTPRTLAESWADLITVEDLNAHIESLFPRLPDENQLDWLVRMAQAYAASMREP